VRLRKLLVDERNRLVLAGALFGQRRGGPKQKKEGKTAGRVIAEAGKDPKGGKKNGGGGKGQRDGRGSVLSCPRFWGELPDGKLKETVAGAREWSAKAVDELAYTPWVLPAFVRGINATAEFQLGFTEPFCRLSLKFKGFVTTSKDMQP